MITVLWSTFKSLNLLNKQYLPAVSEWQRVLAMTTATAGTTPWKKTNLYFTFECRNSVNLFRTSIGLKTSPALTCTDGVQFLKKIPKISHCGLRSPKYMEVGHFTLLFCRGRQRNVPRFKTHVHSHCSAH